MLCADQFDRLIGCRSLKIHRVEISVVGGEHCKMRRAVGNFMIASIQLQFQRLKFGITRKYSRQSLTDPVVSRRQSYRVK
jgi:hypothetical protein